MRTLKRFRYFGLPKTTRRVHRVVAARRPDEFDYDHKKLEITRTVLEHVYVSPCLNEPKQVTARQMRLKMILHEALDIAHAVCEHGTPEQCRFAWEMVDEIDDAATRAGVGYH